MSELDIMLRKYITDKYAEMKGSDITKSNYVDVVAYLKSQEADSYGIVKHADIILFLESWFV